MFCQVVAGSASFNKTVRDHAVVCKFMNLKFPSKSLDYGVEAPEVKQGLAVGNLGGEQSNAK
jgi:hypothetical protein